MYSTIRRLVKAATECPDVQLEIEKNVFYIMNVE